MFFAVYFYMANKLKTTLETLFGKDYRTTITGNAALICAAISLYPDLTDWIHAPFGDYIRGIAGLFTFVFGSKFSKNVADATVAKKEPVASKPVMKTTKVAKIKPKTKT